MGNATVTLDARDFASEVSSRMAQRAQRVIRGTLAGSSSYAGSGDDVDLAPYFPAGKFRVILNPLSNTGNRLAVYDHTNNKLLIYTALGVEAGGATDQSVNGIFGFVAIGE